MPSPFVTMQRMGMVYAIGFSDKAHKAEARAQEKLSTAWESSLTGVFSLARDFNGNPVFQSSRYKNAISSTKLTSQSKPILETKDSYGQTWVVIRAPLDSTWFSLEGELRELIGNKEREENKNGFLGFSNAFQTLQGGMRFQMKQGKSFWASFPPPLGLEKIKE